MPLLIESRNLTSVVNAWIVLFLKLPLFKCHEIVLFLRGFMKSGMPASETNRNSPINEWSPHWMTQITYCRPSHTQINNGLATGHFSEERVPPWLTAFWESYNRHLFPEMFSFNATSFGLSWFFYICSSVHDKKNCVKISRLEYIQDYRCIGTYFKLVRLCFDRHTWLPRIQMRDFSERS